MTNKVYGAFFMGMGGSIFSLGIQSLASKARKTGAVVGVYGYKDYVNGANNIEYYRSLGYKIMLLGYSAGCSTISYLQSPTMNIKNDLLISLAQSELTANYPLNANNTKRAVLWHGNFPADFLSSAGKNLGYNVINETSWPHLLVDWAPDIHEGVLSELSKLQNGV